MSRDGGLNWFEVKKGPWIYEFGDHGALIVMAPMNQATRDVSFSWDEGKTWQTIQITKNPIEVTNIIIEPESTSQQFVVYGVETIEDYLDYDIDFTDFESSDNKAVIVTLDFTNLHEPQCKGVDNAGDGSSDYEIWTPFDGRHGKDKCFMGAKTSYVRRKREATCFNGEETEK